MKIVAIVPIKLNNERLPGKNIKLLKGKPLIKYILETLSEIKKIDEIYVYCSDDAIKYYLDSNIKYLKRPKYLDEATSNFSQIFEEFSKEVNADIYVYAHATSPFVKSETINDCLDNVINKGYDSAFTAVGIQDYLWYNNEPVNFDATNLPRSQDLKKVYRETSGIYVYNKEVFDKYKRRIGIYPYIREVTNKESIDINYYEDFELAEQCGK